MGVGGKGGKEEQIAYGQGPGETMARKGASGWYEGGCLDLHQASIPFSRLRCHALHPWRCLTNVHSRRPMPQAIPRETHSLFLGPCVVTPPLRQLARSHST